MVLDGSNFEANVGDDGTRHPGTVPTLASSRHLDGGMQRRRPPSTYLWYVLAHPANLLYLGTFLLASLVSANLWMFVLTVLVEAAVLAGLPRLPSLRRNVDRQLLSRDRAGAAAVRGSLAGHMSGERRVELTELEQRVETIRTNAERARGRADGVLDELIGLDRLLGSYTRLAVIHRATGESLEMTDRDLLCGEIEELQGQLRAATSTRLREAVARRLGLTRRRLETVDRNRQRLLAMDHQLSTIAEMIRLVHEQSVALMDAGNAADIVESVMLELEQHEQTLQEIVAVCVPDDPPAEPMAEPVALDDAVGPPEPVDLQEPSVPRRARVAS